MLHHLTTLASSNSSMLSRLDQLKLAKMGLGHTGSPNTLGFLIGGCSCGSFLPLLDQRMGDVYVKPLLNQLLLGHLLGKICLILEVRFVILRRRKVILATVGQI